MICNLSWQLTIHCRRMSLWTEIQFENLRKTFLDAWHRKSSLLSIWKTNEFRVDVFAVTVNNSAFTVHFNEDLWNNFTAFFFYSFAKKKYLNEGDKPHSNTFIHWFKFYFELGNFLANKEASQIRTHTWNKQVGLVANKYEKNEPQFTYVQLSFVYSGQPDSERARNFACVRLTEINDIWQHKRKQVLSKKTAMKKECFVYNIANGKQTCDALFHGTLKCVLLIVSCDDLRFCSGIERAICRWNGRNRLTLQLFNRLRSPPTNDKQPNIKSVWQYYIASKNEWTIFVRFVIFAFAMRKTHN